MKRLARWLVVITLITMLLLIVALVLLQSHPPASGERGDWFYGVGVVATMDGARLLVVLLCVTALVLAWRWWRSRRRRAGE